MELTVGQRLRSARGSRGLTVRDVCHETRISHNVIRSLEEDDYSEFSNVTYAKSFLSMYAEYLDQDISDVLPQFVIEERYESFQPHFNESDGSRGSRLRPKKDPARQRTAPVLLFLMLLALVAAIPTVYYVARETDTDLNGPRPEQEAGPSLPEPAGASAPLLANADSADGGPSLPSSSAFPADSRSISLASQEDNAEPPILPARPFRNQPLAEGGGGRMVPSFRSPVNGQGIGQNASASR